MKIPVVLSLLVGILFQFSDETLVGLNVRRVKRQNAPLEAPGPRVKGRPPLPPKAHPPPNIQDLTCQLHKFPMCCGPDKTMRPDSNVQKAFDMCLTKSFGDPSMTQVYSCSDQVEMNLKLTCAYECVALKLNLVSKEGQIDEDIFRNVTKEMYLVQEWQSQFIDDAISAIMKDLKRKNLLNETFVNEISCSPKIQVLLFNFVWLYQQVRCPQQNIIKTNTCNYILKKVKRGAPGVHGFQGPAKPQKPAVAKQKMKKANLTREELRLKINEKLASDDADDIE